MSFQITIEPSGRSFSARADTTILESAVAQEIPLPYGCRDGACGSCICKKISGEVQMQSYSETALRPEELAAGYILPCRALPLSDVVLESKQIGSANMYPVRKMPARVASLEKLSHDVMRVMLQLPANEAFQYHAGQYIDLILRDGSRRSYSMGSMAQTAGQSGGQTGMQTGGQIELHIRYMAGGKFTEHVFNALKEKEILRLEGPLGGFYLRNEETDSGKPMIFLASGTGFAPVKALIEDLEAKNITRPVTLYWGARRPEDLYMHDWVLEKCKTLTNLHYIPVVSDALAEDGWTGRSGFVHQAAMQDVPNMAAHQVYACGAPIVVESAHRDFINQCGLLAENFFSDSFITEKEKAQQSATASPSP